MLGGFPAREDTQQRRLASTVGADQPDDVTRRHDEVQSGEQELIPIARGQLPGDQRGTHQDAMIIDVSQLIRPAVP